MTSILGFNAHLRYIKAATAYADFTNTIRPTYTVAYVDKVEHGQYIKEHAAQFPFTKTIARFKHPEDGGFHLKPQAPGDNRQYVVSPEDYLNAFGEYGRNGLILNVLNEPNSFATVDDTNRLVEWCIEIMQKAAQRGITLVIPNWSDRHPRLVNGEWDSVYDPILRLAALYPELFYIGVHLYGDDEIVSHLNALEKRCKTIGIDMPHCIATEFGLDSTGGTENGYKSRPDWNGKRYADWQIAQVKTDLNHFVQSGKLVGLCTFSYGNSGGWDNFDVETDNDYKQAIITAAKMGELEPVTTPKPQPVTVIQKPDAAIIGIRQMINNFGAGQTVHRSLRTRPEWTATETGQVYKGSIVRVYAIPVETGVIKSDGTKGRWNYVEKLDAEKAITNSGWMWIDNITFANGSTSTNEMPPVSPAPAPSTPPPAENPANTPSGAITGLSRADIEKQVVIAEMQLAYWRDVLARAA